MLLPALTPPLVLLSSSGRFLGPQPGRPTMLTTWSCIALCAGSQWSAVLLHLTSVTLVGAEIRRDQWRSPPAVNFTVVTAMFDIGRGEWQSEFARPYQHYLSFLEPVMKLKVNMVAFADSVAAASIRRLRAHLSGLTHLVEMRLQDIPYFRLRDRFQRIMNSENYSKGNPQSFMRHPEANVADYDVLMLSKAHFVREAVRLDPFHSSYFLWLDGGYGHGQDTVFPEDGGWYPQNLFTHADKVTMVELGRGWVRQARDHVNELHTIRGSLVMGGFFGGGKEAVRRLYRLEREVVEGWMARGVVDDDQSCRVAAYFRDPGLFRLVRGDWWDVFRLFNDTAAVS